MKITIAIIVIVFLFGVMLYSMRVIGPGYKFKLFEDNGTQCVEIWDGRKTDKKFKATISTLKFPIITTSGPQDLHDPIIVPGKQVKFADLTIRPGRVIISIQGIEFDVMESVVVVDKKDFKWNNDIKL
jgi:hypothetical protein